MNNRKKELGDCIAQLNMMQLRLAGMLKDGLLTKEEYALALKSVQTTIHVLDSLK